MKSEERHYLAENELEKVLSHGQALIVPHLNKILIGTVVLFVLVGGLYLWNRSVSKATEAGWSEFIKAKSADEYATVADRFSGKEVGTWSRLRAAEMYLNEGLDASITDSKLTESRLKLAGQAFQTVLGGSTTPEIRERALYGLAVTTEAQCNGDPKAAIAAYKTFQTEFGASRRAELVNERIAALESEDGKAFYTWFAGTTRTLENRPQPKDWKRGGVPEDPLLMDLNEASELPRDPNRPPSPEKPTEGDSARPFPSTDSELFPGTKPEMKPETTPGTTPATTPETTPVDPPKAETPATPETPKTETPATPETPKTETPATPEAPTSETPATPEAPKTETPATPESPKTETPATPESPKTETPATPETPQPEATATPETPAEAVPAN